MKMSSSIMHQLVAMCSQCFRFLRSLVDPISGSITRHLLKSIVAESIIMPLTQYLVIRLKPVRCTYDHFYSDLVRLVCPHPNDVNSGLVQWMRLSKEWLSLVRLIVMCMVNICLSLTDWKPKRFDSGFHQWQLLRILSSQLQKYQVQQSSTMQHVSLIPKTYAICSLRWVLRLLVSDPIDLRLHEFYHWGE